MLRRGKPKQQTSKIQNLSEGPETFGFLVFLGFLWFSSRNPKKNMFFLILGGKPKKHRVFFGFLVRSLVKTKKTLCFLGFHLKSKQQTMCFFGFLLENKKPRKNKDSKSFGPLRKVLDLWIFGFVVPSAKTKKPKIQKSKTFLRGPKLFGIFGFPRFFGFPTEIQKVTCFFDFNWKSKKHVFFWFSCSVSGEKQTKPVSFGFLFWISVRTSNNP